MRGVAWVLGTILLLAGCDAMTGESPERAARWAQRNAERVAKEQKDKELWTDRRAALKDGRIKIGMTGNEFLKIWPQAGGYWDKSESHFAGHDLFTVRYRDFTVYPNGRDLVFTFDNGILDNWHEY
jgi:hypothetical protein